MQIININVSWDQLVHSKNVLSRKVSYENWY